MESIWEERECCGDDWSTARLHQKPKKPTLHPGNTEASHGETDEKSSCDMGELGNSISALPISATSPYKHTIGVSFITES